MCFSATANFVGSGVLGAVGVVTLTKVKHRRELLFAALPMLFAIHQFMEGFVWLGLDGILSPAVAHDMGAAFMLYAQGLLPFLLPLSVLLFEPNAKSRRRMLPFLILGGATTLYILWALTAFPLQLYVRGNSIVFLFPTPVLGVIPEAARRTQFLSVPRSHPRKAAELWLRTGLCILLPRLAEMFCRALQVAQILRGIAPGRLCQQRSSRMWSV